MILRSRRLPAARQKEPATPRSRLRSSGRRRSSRSAKLARETRTKEEVVLDGSDDEGIPAVVKRNNLQAKTRRMAVTSEDTEGLTDTEFKTPVRGRQPRVHFQEGKTNFSSRTAVRNIYSPIVRFMTPTKGGVKSLQDEALSPEQCVFEYGFFSPLTEEDKNAEVFNPYAFIKNIPSQSQQTKPWVRDIPVKTRSTPQATLVLDLDETLVFSSLNVIADAEYTFHTWFQDHQYKVYVNLRPYVKEFLQSMSKVFEMIVYTSAKKEYAEKILEILDPQKKLFRHRLYQENCFCILGHYVKDLGLLERDLAKTVVLDNSPHTIPYHLMNMIPVLCWVGDKEDRELLKLIPYLEKLSEADDFREVLKQRMDHLHRLLSED